MFSEVLIDRSFPHQNLPTRKPGTAMLTHYIKGDYDLENSYVIGDRETDIQLAKNLGCKAIYLNGGPNPDAVLSTASWASIYDLLKNEPRKATVKRTTAETDITVRINLDGTGKSRLATGIGFFDHMLEQVARHGRLDLEVAVIGDLHIDEHHTIEDVAITLGAAFRQALGLKKGIERYGFLLPMDDVLAQVAIDFGGRPWLVWDVVFNREMIGGMPTEMFFHFFKSFSDEAKCNLNIKAEGINEHHKIEAIFKAFAKAVCMAVSKTNSFSIPSTKGIL
jgi:imidazoleglycerol-phosphate dehydratase/histidinol-phosphatase